MQGSYNYYLVALSLLVAMFASYTALDLAGRIGSLHGSRKRFFWLCGGAVAMGMGIWSMHFIGMLAFRMPIQLGYDAPITICSMLIAIVVSGFALFVVTRDELSRTRLAIGGVIMGLGVAAMHYTGMAALRMSPAIVYTPVLLWASIGVAIVASWVALWIAFQLRDGQQSYVLLKRCAAGLVMGLAIAGMHYLGMAAANFPMGSVCDAANGVSTGWLAFTVAGATLLVLPMTLMYSMLDARYDLQEFQLNASLEKARLNASLAEANERLLAMATEDALTGLPNRNSLIERIEIAIGEARRTNSSFTLLFIDLDGFKTVNDSLGHPAGDKLLRKFSRRLIRCVREEDTVARLSGDEFVILLERLNQRSDIEQITESILERTRQDFLINGSPLRLTASLGSATYPQDGATVDDLLKNADTAMYDAKQSGRNACSFFDIKMSEALSRTLMIQRGLSEALEYNQLSLRFQPKFGMRREMLGAEALIRWRHPVLGEISPLEFISIAERTGQIIPIGNWVIAEVCRYIGRWKQARVPVMKIAINLSREQLRQPDYVRQVLDITNPAGVDPSWIMFEMTETVAMRDAELTSEVVRQFQKAGFDVAIDDFGKGYSSLAHLQQFRVKQLKIDRFFIDGLDRHGEEGYAMVSAIISLAHALDMVVVAEGVETNSQLEQLRRLRCDELQGFLLAKPLSASKFEEILHSPAKTESRITERLTSRWYVSRWRQQE
ncbi:bifunctional diguanylate cyclase/phosphodiesterase [Edaphobacter acidisoli]|uniref:Bifunctional diguanylate cyclase/phosphodiesterase n=1 Tax=Edaphobacter acidisoli TaxID=2040573 RepID=A0A916RXT7_9BACT|nr:EAL domain-containing protein [Edaphobacter acidisoli]GGA71491.1 bifunctional diguanylate cyclase/phosphodiesterase [Edaphobacter acidisoli]